MSGLFEAPTVYAADFEEAWQAYKPPKNSTKFEAYTAWQKTAKVRMHAGAFGHRMVECCRLYSEWIDAENARRARQRQSDHPKKHFSSWINARGWEAFMPEAETRWANVLTKAAKAIVNFDGWETEAENLAGELGPEKFAAWFADVQVAKFEEVGRNQHFTLTFPSHFKAAHCAKSFPYALRRAFGACTLVVSGSPKERFDI